MDLEMRHTATDYWEGGLSYVHPLEEVLCNRDTDFKEKQVPTEQGRLLLQFIMRHLFAHNNIKIGD